VSNDWINQRLASLTLLPVANYLLATAPPLLCITVSVAATLTPSEHARRCRRCKGRFPVSAALGPGGADLAVVVRLRTCSGTYAKLRLTPPRHDFTRLGGSEVAFTARVARTSVDRARLLSPRRHRPPKAGAHPPFDWLTVRTCDCACAHCAPVCHCKG